MGNGADAPVLWDKASRKRKAAKIWAILQRVGPPEKFAALRCLDVGCGSGLIAQALAPHFRQVLGVEKDSRFMGSWRVLQGPKLQFLRGDALHLPLADASVDVVICAQVYEHVDDAQVLVQEIRRVLTPGGICFFSGPNRLALIEEHYKLPFVSWLPRSWAGAYLRLFGRAEYYAERPLTYWGLRRLWEGFQWRDFTWEMIRLPEEFFCVEELRIAPWLKWLPGWLLRLLRPFYPNYNWLLVKPAEEEPCTR